MERKQVIAARDYLAQLITTEVTDIKRDIVAVVFSAQLTTIIPMEIKAVIVVTDCLELGIIMINVAIRQDIVLKIVWVTQHIMTLMESGKDIKVRVGFKPALTEEYR